MENNAIQKDLQPRLVDLEMINTLTDGCPACGKPFILGEQIVPACGNWDGLRHIHLSEAHFDSRRNLYVDRNC